MEEEGAGEDWEGAGEDWEGEDHLAVEVMAVEGWMEAETARETGEDRSARERPEGDSAAEGSAGAQVIGTSPVHNVCTALLCALAATWAAVPAGVENSEAVGMAAEEARLVLVEWMDRLW